MIFRRKIIVVAVFLLLLPFFANAKVYLVSVGVSDYPGNSMDLVLPANDAKTITWVYSKNNDLSYIQLLNNEATTANIIAAMKKVYNLAKANDIVVFFFSGHGYEGGFCSYDGFLPYSTIRSAMAKSQSNNKMIFADACYAGQMREKNTKAQADAKQVTNAQKASVLLFLASRSNEYSLENPKMSNGYFTNSLQKGLRGDADKNKDRTITAKELYNYVHSKVIAETNNQQHPVMWGKFSDNMPVIKW